MISIPEVWIIQYISIWKHPIIPGESRLNAAAGVCGLDVDAGFEGLEGFDPELMNFSICADFSGRSCRVFLSNMWPDNFSNVISPVVLSIINTHSFWVEFLICPL